MDRISVSLPAAPPIDSYGDGGFRLGGGFVAGSILLLPGRLEGWPVRSWTDVSAEAVAPLLAIADEIDFVLLGCGVEIAAVPRDVRAAFEAAGLAVDAMQTGAACRTYNVVLAEGRRMAAGLIAVE